MLRHPSLYNHSISYISDISDNMEQENVDFERTLCQIREVFVFKIPIRSSAAGHRAADWPKEPAMKASLKVSAKGRLAVVTMTNPQNGDIFATCPVTDDTAVERTLDSGRYFVFRIQNAQGRHAFIGVAFNERNDAFDFNVALSEHKRECDREDNASKASEDATSIPFRDLSLKEGEKITVKIAGSSVSHGCCCLTLLLLQILHAHHQL